MKHALPSPFLLVALVGEKRVSSALQYAKRCKFHTLGRPRYQRSRGYLRIIVRSASTRIGVQARIRRTQAQACNIQPALP
jgi:hypothetical protein